MSTLIRVEIPDPMAPMWAKVGAAENTPDNVLAWLSNLCPSSKHEAPTQRWICTRRRLHTGRHYASDGETILAVWG